MQLMWGDLNFDHSKTNAKFLTLKKCFRGYDGNDMSPTGFTRQTIISQTRIDVVYCPQGVQVDVLKPTITDHYTVQTELDEKTIETGLKKQENYTN